MDGSDPVLRALMDEIIDFERSVADLPVTPDVTPGEIRARLSHYDFAQPVDLEALFHDITDVMRRWSLHVTHPRYFGLFNPSTRRAGVVADALVALYNPQLAAWPHAPVANEIERHLLAWLMRQFEMDPVSGLATFTTGGQEANQSAVTAAMTQAFAGVGESGLRSLHGAPVMYVSAEAHHSFLKIAHQSGLGRAAVREVPVDTRLRMDPGVLRRMIEADRAAGALPFLVVGTAGTTAAGAIDPLPDIAAIAQAEGLWFHVDAAWGGAAIVSPTLRRHLAGSEQADSVTCDAHKWLSAPVGAGMFLCRHREPVLQAFRVEASSYVPPAVPDTLDPYVTTIQWSRRFIGLKVFMTIAELGQGGLASQIERQASMADLLRDELVARGWLLVNDSPLAIVCFTHPRIEDGTTTSGAVAEQVLRSGSAWISEVRLSGRSMPALRACVTSWRTEPEDVAVLVGALEAAVA